jgi:cytochrome c-type biogenesis protein CcmE
LSDLNQQMKKTHLIGILVIAIAIAAIVSTFSDSSSYASFAESKQSNKEIHVVGKLQKEKEMIYNPIQDANYFSFYVKDQEGEECKVIYAGTKPQDFEKSEQIVLIGKMQADEFHASKILMKCPSKYTNDKVETKEFKAQTS